ncbi:MAG TPA: hypothetical protein VGM90_10635 [Kofleriaceae bacterium]|jgi:DNA-binding response OmpR family regulator
MKVLVAISDQKERKRVVAILAAAKYEAIEAGSPVAATALLAQVFDIAFVDTGVVARARGAARRIFVIATVGALATTSDYWAAYSAGADDVMKINAPKDEVIGRAGALCRIRAWAAPPKTLAERLASLPVWATLDSVIAAELGEMVGDTLALSTEPCGTVVHASEIPLTLTSEQIQIRVGLGIDQSTMTALQRTLLGGDTSGEAMLDAMREMANTAGGAIKRAALEHGVEFTIGLPSNTNVVNTTNPERRSWTLSGSAIALTCVAHATSSAPRVIVIKDLREGMILARDVLNSIGTLIAPAGTSVTRTTVEQLARILGTATTLEVSDAA